MLKLMPKLISNDSFLPWQNQTAYDVVPNLVVSVSVCVCVWLENDK